MRAVVQRVGAASVAVEGEVVGSIRRGLVVLLGVAPSDTAADAKAMADKLVGLRIFGDGEGKMNRSVVDVGGEVLVVSQFTLFGDVRRGRRPSFSGAAGPETARPLVEEVTASIAAEGVPVSTGSFGAHMEVHLVNDGPVTLFIEVTDGKVA